MEDKPVYKRRSDYWFLAIIIYICLIAMGIVENAKSVTFPMLKTYFKLSDDMYGLFLACLGVSYIIFTFVATIAAEYISYRWIIDIGYICLGFGCVLVSVTTTLPACVVVLFVVWMGFGLFEIGSNASSTVVFIEHRGTMMSLMHFFFGIGAAAGPLVAEYAAKWLGHDFYSSYLCLGCIVLILFAITVFMPFNLPTLPEKPETPKEAVESRLTFKKAIRMPSIWLSSCTMASYMILEGSGSNWAPLYLQDVLGFSIEDEIPKFSTALYVVFTISRLISGPIIDRIGYYTFLFYGVAINFVLLVVGVFIGKYGIYCFILCGLFYSGYWPIFICVLVGFYKQQAAGATSAVIILQAVLCLPCSYIFGALNEYIGKQSAYHCTMVFCIIAELLLWSLWRLQQKKEAKEAKEAKEVEMNSITPTVCVEMKEEDSNTQPKPLENDISVKTTNPYSCFFKHASYN